MIRSEGRDGPTIALSPREAEVARLVADGLRPAAIAERLFITRKSAEDYIWHLMQGVGVSTRYELMLWALRNPAAIGPQRLPAPVGLRRLEPAA